MSNKILLVIQREFMTRIKKKSFIILTLLMPFLIVGLVALPIVLGTIKSDEETEVFVVDKTGKYAPLFTTDGRFHYVASDTLNTSGAPCVVIGNDPFTTPNAVAIYNDEEVPHDLQQSVTDILDRDIHRQKLEKYNVPQLDDIIQDIQTSVSVQTVKRTENGDMVSSSVLATIVGYFFTFLIYMFVLTYGSMVMQGVMEEKTNRIMELMVSSIKPFEMMMGKILGILCVGLFQMLIWLVMVVAMLFALAGVMSDSTLWNEITSAGSVLGMFSTLPMGELGLMFVLYFLGGYVLYTSYFAACGAAVNSQEDSGMFMTPMIFVMVFAMYAAMGSAENTDGPLAFWSSMFPLTSPIVMMIRIPFGVPLWEELLSLGILFATALGCVWVGAKIYRTGILMYGKKPSLKEMWKWVKFK